MKRFNDVFCFFLVLLLCCGPEMFAAGQNASLTTPQITTTFYVYLYHTSYESDAYLRALNYYLSNASALITAAAGPVFATRNVSIDRQLLAITQDRDAPPVSVAACSPGSTFLNGTACVPCDGCAGEYRLAWCAGRNDSVCVGACPPGSYAHNGGAPVYSLGGCTWCGAGQYTSMQGKSTCDTCAMGTFSERIGATACEACNANNNTHSTGCMQVLTASSVAQFFTIYYFAFCTTM
jgi:hypothetical protein